MVADFGVAQQFAIPGVAVPVRSALARAIAATSGYDSDTGHVHSDDDDDGECVEEEDEEAFSAVTSGDEGRGVVSTSSPRRSAVGHAQSPGWVADTAGTFQFLAPEVRKQEGISFKLIALGPC